MALTCKTATKMQAAMWRTIVAFFAVNVFTNFTFLLANIHGEFKEYVCYQNAIGLASVVTFTVIDIMACWVALQRQLRDKVQRRLGDLVSAYEVE